MSTIKAILFGLNYEMEDYKLDGCINDVKLVKNCLEKFIKVPNKNITVCHDKTNMKPTSDNIKSIIIKGIEEVNNNPKLITLWIHFSGHGYYVLDENEDEDKKNDIMEGDGEYGWDEVLVGLDGNFISDDELNKIFSKLNKNKKLVCVFDCCHSGTLLDLPYRYNHKTNKCVKESKRNNSIVCDAILLSGCRDIEEGEDSYGISSKYTYTGAFTTALLKSLERTLSLSIDVIMEEAYKFLKEKNIAQNPQVTCSKNINKNTKIIISPYRDYVIKKIKKYERYIKLCDYYYNKTKKYIFKRYKNYFIILKNKLLIKLV